MSDDGIGARPILERILAPGGDEQRALCGRDAAVTYGELRANVLALRDSLRNNGIGAGDRVALHLPKTIATVELILAVLATDAAYVPLSPRLRGAALRRMLEDLRPSLLIAPGDASAEIRGQAALPGLRVAAIRESGAAIRLEFIGTLPGGPARSQDSVGGQKHNLSVKLSGLMLDISI